MTHTMWARTQTIIDWRINIWCACGEWERFDVYDWPAAHTAFEEHHARRDPRERERQRLARKSEREVIP